MFRPSVLCVMVSLLVISQTSCHRQSDGFLKKTYVDGDGRKARYIVFVPPHRPRNEKLPVILFLNGFGENGDDGLLQISNNFGADVWRMRGYFPFLTVCPQCSLNGTWHPDSDNAKTAMAILERTIQEFGGDPDRVYLTGVSVGGSGALQLAAAHPDRFAAVVPIAAGGKAYETLAQRHMPIWHFYNRFDRASLVDEARQTRREFFQMGLSPWVTEFNQDTHNAWDAAYGSPALFAWLLEQNRQDQSSQRPFKLLTVDDVIRIWERRGPDVWQVANTEELTTKELGPNTRAMLVAPLDLVDSEFHFDVFLSAGRFASCVLVPLGEGLATHEVLLRLPQDGVGEFRKLDGERVSSLDPVGQLALVEGWNDVRLIRKNGQLVMHVNGWQTLNVADLFSGKPWRWGFSVAPGNELRWRYLRHRSVESDTR